MFCAVDIWTRFTLFDLIGLLECWSGHPQGYWLSSPSLEHLRSVFKLFKLGRLDWLNSYGPIQTLVYCLQIKIHWYLFVLIFDQLEQSQIILSSMRDCKKILIGQWVKMNWCGGWCIFSQPYDAMMVRSGFPCWSFASWFMKYFIPICRSVCAKRFQSGTTRLKYSSGSFVSHIAPLQPNQI